MHLAIDQKNKYPKKLNSNRTLLSWSALLLHLRSFPWRVSRDWDNKKALIMTNGCFRLLVNKIINNLVSYNILHVFKVYTTSLNCLHRNLYFLNIRWVFSYFVFLMVSSALGSSYDIWGCIWIMCFAMLCRLEDLFCPPLLFVIKAAKIINKNK